MEMFKMPYNQRAGIEGTLSQGVRVGGLRQARYCGQANVRLQQALTAVALNFSRLFAWLIGPSPARTRHVAFVRLTRL
jgi:transposase